MKQETKIKLGCLIVLASWGLLLIVMGADPFYGEITVQVWLLIIIPEFLIAPLLLFNIILDLIKQKEEVKAESKEISLSQKIVKLAYSNNKVISVYDIMAKVNEKEEKIRSQLIEFEQKGAAERFISSTGQEMYRFMFSITPEERKDILE